MKSENVISFLLITGTLSCFGYALYCYEISRKEEIDKREKERQNLTWNPKEAKQIKKESTQYIKNKPIEKENVEVTHGEKEDNIDIPEVIEVKQKEIPEYFNAKEYTQTKEMEKEQQNEAEKEQKKTNEADNKHNKTNKEETIQLNHNQEENKNEKVEELEKFRKLVESEENRILEMEETEKKRKKFESERIEKALENEYKKMSIVYHSIAARKMEDERHAEELKRINQMQIREKKRKEAKEIELAEARQRVWKMKEKLDNGESILELLEKKPKPKVYPDMPDFTKKEESQIPEEYQKLIQKRITLKLHPSKNKPLTIKNCISQICKSCGLLCKEENMNITDDITVPSFIVKNKKAIECIELICNANGFKYSITKDGLEIK